MCVLMEQLVHAADQDQINAAATLPTPCLVALLIMYDVSSFT